ncbi:hypothetical protein NE237_013290 [Protea cynaroides]|uniref:Pentatricopeptide repeat-containing protein n=1 Tax=Protea cynaroides TaxID=273540 RepID=A0A9Q0JYV0_9MAGN|nr:hypothetical protein NE237_013290 [Protea cynaroides]
MIRRKVTPNSITSNIVISGLSWCCSTSVVTYNTLIDGYCKMGRVGKMYKADALLKEMISSKIYPNEITFNSLIDGYCKDENTSAAIKLFKEMKRQACDALSIKNEMMGLNLKPSIVTYNALINGFSKKGMFNEAKVLFDNIADHGLFLNVITFNILMDAYCKFREIEKAIRLHGFMLETTIQPNISTYNCLNKGVPADLMTYNILIGALCREEESRKAVRLLHEMFEMGVRPSHLTNNMTEDKK